MTAKGRRAFAPLDAASRVQATELLAAMPAPARAQLVGAMGAVQSLPSATASQEIALCQPGPGDIGWVVQAHGALYAQEYGWDWTFAALVARICADFVDHFQPARERAWIAHRGETNVGCAFVVEAPPAEFGPGMAKLRLLLVDPSARGSGLGTRLVDKCERFAVAAGYRKMTLWTNSALDAARTIYVKHG